MVGIERVGGRRNFLQTALGGLAALSLPTVSRADESPKVDTKAISRPEVAVRKNPDASLDERDRFFLEQPLAKVLSAVLENRDSRVKICDQNKDWAQEVKDILLTKSPGPLLNIDPETNYPIYTEESVKQIAKLVELMLSKSKSKDGNTVSVKFSDAIGFQGGKQSNNSTNEKGTLYLMGNPDDKWALDAVKASIDSLKATGKNEAAEVLEQRLVYHAFVNNGYNLYFKKVDGKLYPQLKNKYNLSLSSDDAKQYQVFSYGIAHGVINATNFVLIPNQAGVPEAQIKQVVPQGKGSSSVSVVKPSDVLTVSLNK